MGAGQAISAIGSYQSASSQTAAKNQQIAANYNQRRVAYEKGNLDRLAIYNAQVASFISKRRTIEEANQERIKQWRSVNLGPGEAGPAPEMPTFLKGPSKLGLAVGLAGAALTAAAPAFKSKPGLEGGGLTEWNTDMALDAAPIPYNP